MFLAERMLDGPGEPDDDGDSGITGLTSVDGLNGVGLDDLSGNPELAEALDRLADLDDLGIDAVDLAEHFEPDAMPLLADLSNPALRLRAPAQVVSQPVFGGRSGRPVPNDT